MVGKLKTDGKIYDGANLSFRLLPSVVKVFINWEFLIPLKSTAIANTTLFIDFITMSCFPQTDLRYLAE